MSARTDELGDDQFVAIDVVMEALGVGRRRAYQLARESKWRSGGGGYRFGDVRATYARRKAEQEAGHQPRPRIASSRASKADTPR